jgi:hypothetical protein
MARCNGQEFFEGFGRKKGIKAKRWPTEGLNITEKIIDGIPITEKGKPPNHPSKRKI